MIQPLHRGCCFLLCKRVIEHQPVGHVLSVNSESGLLFDAYDSTEMVMVKRVHEGRLCFVREKKIEN